MLTPEAIAGLAQQRHSKVHVPGGTAYIGCSLCIFEVEKEERIGSFWRAVYMACIHNQLPAEEADTAVREAKVRGYL